MQFLMNESTDQPFIFGVLAGGHRQHDESGRRRTREGAWTQRLNGQENRSNDQNGSEDVQSPNRDRERAGDHEKNETDLFGFLDGVTKANQSERTDQCQTRYDRRTYGQEDHRDRQREQPEAAVRVASARRRSRELPKEEGQQQRDDQTREQLNEEPKKGPRSGTVREHFHRSTHASVAVTFRVLGNRGVSDA